MSRSKSKYSFFVFFFFLYQFSFNKDLRNDQLSVSCSHYNLSRVFVNEKVLPDRCFEWKIKFSAAYSS